MEAVQVMYFMALNDGFGNCSRTPSNDNPLKVGVASVECSVNGQFYNPLPSARDI